jgi:hypothetical protein
MLARPHCRKRGALASARLAAVTLALLLCCAYAGAQTGAKGAVRGRIQDGTGGAVAGAAVSIHNQENSFSLSTRTDSGGSYLLPELPLAGAYTLSVEREGFAPQERADLALRAGETATVDFVIQPAASEGSITVYGTTDGVRSNSPQLGTRLDALKIEQTPIAGRKLTSLPLLDSAVRTARGTGDLFLNNTLFVITGGGRRQPTFSIDGGSADDAWGRQSIFTNVPLDAVQEVTVLTNAFSAEYGHGTGGVVNVVTRAGADQRRGDFTLLYRPGSLQSGAPVTGQDADDELLQGSGFLSGVLIGDRLYGSIAAEYSRQNRDSVITSPLEPGVFTGEYRQTLLFGRLDAVLSPSHHLTGRFDSDRFEDSNPQDAVGGLSLPSAARTFSRGADSIFLGETAVLSNRAYNDLRLTYSNGDPITEFEPARPSTQLVRPGVATEGESRFAHLTNRQQELADTFSLALGKHFLKMGGDYLRSRSGGDGKEFGTPFVLGQFTFRSGIPASVPTSQLTLADVQRYTQGFGNAHYSVTDEIWSLFAQDDFRVHSDLVLNLGLRYDRQSLTDGTDDLSPRLGFAWSPGGGPRTTVRGSYGRYYSQIQANTVSNWELGGPTGFFSFSAGPGQLGFPNSLEPLAGFPPGIVLPPADITVAPGRAGFYSQYFDVSRLGEYPDQLLNPRTDQVTLGAERKFADSWYLSLDAVHSTTEDIVWFLDINAPTSFDRTAPGQSRSPNAADATRPIRPVANGYRRILAPLNVGRSKYDGLLLNLRHDFSGRGSLVFSYTWSHARNNVEPDAPGSDPQDVRQRGSEWADSRLDQRHRIVASGWLDLPAAFRTGGVVSYASGRPYNVTTGNDNNGDGARTDRPVVDGSVLRRNSELGDSLFDLTLFVEREFVLSGLRLALRAEALNVTDHENVVGYNGTYGDAATGQPQAGFGDALGGVANVEPGRQYQFLVRMHF